MPWPQFLPQGNIFCVGFHTAEPLHISGTIIVTKQGLYAVCNTHLQKGDKHIGLKYNSDGRHRVITISYQKLIQHDCGNTHQSGENCSRKTGSADLRQNRLPDGKVTPFQ